MQLPQKSESLSPQEISRELAMLRSEMVSCGQEKAGNYANILANSAAPPRELDTAVFVRQLVTLLAEYPDKACDHVVKTYPRNHVTCSLKRVADALDEAKYEMESAIAKHQSHLRRIEEKKPEEEYASTPEEDAKMAQGFKELLAHLGRGVESPAKPARKLANRDYDDRRKAAHDAAHAESPEHTTNSRLSETPKGDG